MEAKATKTRSYDPGTPGRITHKGHGVFTVQSFRNREDDYTVSLNAGSCTCKHHVNRGVICKHIQLATEESARLARETARTLPASQLHSLLRTKSYRPEVQEAIREVIFEKLHDMVNTVSEQVKSREYARI